MLGYAPTIERGSKTLIGKYTPAIISVRKSVLVSLTAAFALCGHAAAAQKPPVDYTSYDHWNSYTGTALSPDGVWLAYGTAPQEGDGVLVIRNLQTGSELREPRGKAPRFSEDSRVVFYTISATAADLEAARRAHKKGDQLPKEGFGVVTLASGTVFTADRVKSYVFPKHGSRYVAYLEWPPASASPSPAPSPASSASPGPAASASPTPENKKKAETGTLVIRDLLAATRASRAASEFALPDRVASVSEFAVSDDERYLAYATETPNGTGDGVHVRDLRNIAAYSNLGGTSGRYVHLVFAADDSLAFETDRDSFAQNAPHFEVYLWRAGEASASPVVTAASRGLPRGWAPDADGSLEFSKDAKRLFIGANVAPTPLPKNTPEPMQVDLWNWRDARLQSEQKVAADDDRKRTYLGVYHLGTQRYVQLGSPHLADIQVNDNSAFALGRDATPYLAQHSWDDFFDNEFAVSLQTGAKRLVARRQRENCELSPAGKYALCYDRLARAWYTVRTSDGRKTYLTKRLKVAFYDEMDDHPAPPPPYGIEGWLAGDQRVLVLDRYDIWSIDPDSANAFRLTNGYGRAHAVRFSRIQLDSDKPFVGPNAPLYLDGFNDRTKDDGFYVLSATKSAANPRALIAGSARYALLLKAKHADRFVFSRQTFREYPNLWSTTSSFAKPVRVSDVNPQLAKYRWGTEHLVHFTSLQGKHLDAVLYLPDGFDPHRKYPMLVYFYERLTDGLHGFVTPRPSTGPSFSRYVSNGYVVLLPDIAYTTGHPGQSAYDAVMPAIDSVVRRGFIDPKRIGVSGHSWGAYQIAYILTRTNRFAAAEAGAAVADMPSAYGGIRWGSGLVREFQYETGQSRIGATPWNRPDLYLENSALFHVQNVRTPYLTIANDNDDAVPWYQGIEFFSALRRLHREAYMFSFNGEFHNLRGREQQKYWTVHFDEFFDHFLMGKPTPGWMTKGVDYLHRGERDVRPLFGEKP